MVSYWSGVGGAVDMSKLNSRGFEGFFEGAGGMV